MYKYNQVPNRCDMNTKTIKYLERQINTLRVQQRKIMSRKINTQLDFIDMEEFSATISKYQRRINDLKIENEECELDFYKISYILL
jgi:ABC-type phosphate transport system auxiliary subunit